MAFQPLEKKRYSEQVAHEIETKILNKELPLGQRLLSEVDLAKEFHVSRTVIREALRLLEGRGFVKIKRGPKGGIFASDGFHKPLSQALGRLVDSGRVSAGDIFEFRLLFEPYVTEEAAKRATEEDIAELRALISLARENLEDSEALQRIRGKFHVQLAHATGNPVLHLVMNALIELLRKYFSGFHEAKLERHFVDTHEQILQAIIAREPEKAREQMARDIVELMRRVPKTKPSPPSP